MRIKVIVEPKSPLVLGDGQDVGNVRISRDYVAGSALRGALAQVILSRLGLHSTDGRGAHGNRSDPRLAQFNQVFTATPAARFGCLYPSVWLNDSAPESYPAPATALCCKKHRDKHPVLDLLRGELKHEERPRLCGCNARLERYRGFALSANKDNPFRADVPRRPLVRVGLNRWTETAEDQVLYVLDAILPLGDPQRPLAFTGYWEMSEPQWRTLQQLLNEFFQRDSGGGYRLRLGSARARGMGEAILHTQMVATDTLSARFEAFQTGLPQDGYVYCSLTARAPTLLYDALATPTVKLNNDTLRRYLTNVPPGLESVAHGTFIERELFSGWSQAWGLPKPVLPSIAPGSVYTFRAPAAEREAVLRFLQEIETNGLGERLGEGLGEFNACDPFHLAHATKQPFHNEVSSNET